MASPIRSPVPAVPTQCPEPPIGVCGGWRAMLAAARGIGSRAVLDRSWDQLLYCCAAAGLASLIIWWFLPQSKELGVFAWLMFLTSGPFSTFLPSASEPILMAFGKVYPPLLLACIGVSAIAFVEWLNYRVFGVVLLARQTEKVRSARITRTLLGWFEVMPFATVVIAALTPIPFWLARCCAVITQYPMGRFIVATAIGRFPRIWFIAAVGALLPVSSATILTVGGGVVLAAGVVAARRRYHTPHVTVPADLSAPSGR